MLQTLQKNEKENFCLILLTENLHFLNAADTDAVL